MTAPCPFCGSTGYANGARFRVECPVCGCSGPRGATLSDAEAKWDRQSALVRLSEAREERGEILRERDAYYWALRYVRELLDQELSPSRLELIRNVLDGGLGFNSKVH